MLRIDNNQREHARTTFERALASFSNAPLLPPVSIKACTCASGVCPSHINGIPIPPPLPPSSRGSQRSRSRSCALTHRIDSKERIDQKDETTKARGCQKNIENERDENVGRRRSASQKRDDVKTRSKRAQSADKKEPEITSSEESIAFEKWLHEKNANKRQLDMERQLIEKAIVHERMRKLEMERKNFENWMSSKKLEERRRKEQQAKREKELERIEKERERKKNENEMQYRLWCKRKEQQQLEDQLRKEVERVRKEDGRREKIERNAAAYEEWLRSSKNKPRPLPLNRGIDSLRSSVSVSYVNPRPWEPNVELDYDTKPTSQ